MLNKKAFTLIELLAVIVVLAIIAVIAVPVILGVIDKAKLGALKDSAYGLVEASELYLAKNMGKEIETKEFTCSNGTCLSGTEKISYKGNIDSGKIRIYSDSKIELCITDNNNAALKTVASEKVEVSTGTCDYGALNYDVVALVSKAALDAKQAELDEYKEEVASNNLVALFSGVCTNSTSWATYNSSYFDSLFINKVNNTYVLKSSGTYQLYSYGVVSCWGCNGANTGGGRFLVNGVASLTNSFTNSGIGTLNVALNEGDIITWQQYGCIYNCVNTMGSIYKVQ